MSQDLEIFSAKINPNLPVVDLHKYKIISEAIDFLETKIYKYNQEGIKKIRIVHGVGEGVMKKNVHQLLRQNNLVKAFELEDNGGSTVVVL